MCRAHAAWSLCFVSGVPRVSCVWRLCVQCAESLPSEEGEVKGDEGGVAGTPQPQSSSSSRWSLRVQPRARFPGTPAGEVGGERVPGHRPLPAQMASQVATSATLCKTSFKGGIRLRRGRWEQASHGATDDLRALHGLHPASLLAAQSLRDQTPQLCPPSAPPTHNPPAPPPLPVHFWGLCAGLLSRKSLTFSPPFPKATCVQGVPWDHISAKGP